MDSIKVKLDNKELVVSKLPLKSYADLLKNLNKLPEYLAKLDEVDEDAFIGVLPTLIADALPDVILLIECATDLTKEEIENLGAAEAIDLISAIITVNRYGDIVGKVKKVLSSTNQTPAQTLTKTGTTPEKK